MYEDYKGKNEVLLWFYIPSGYVHHGGGRVRSCSPGKKTTQSNYQNKVDEVEAVVVKLKENTPASRNKSVTASV